MTRLFEVQLNMLRAIIFDMDGLMIDTEPLYWDAARRIAARFGTTVSDATLRRMMGRSRLDSMRIFAADCAIAPSVCTVEQLLDERERLMIERYRAPGGVTPMPGLIELLDRFRGRTSASSVEPLRYAIATSSPRKFVDVLLPAMGIADMFEVVQTGDDVTHGKPNPEIYLKAIQKLRLTAAECVVLEDSTAGAVAGKRAGAYVIAVPSPLTAGEDFSKIADVRVENLRQAGDVVDRLLRG